MAAAPSLSRDTRDKIVVAGQRLMASKGFTGVGLNEILSSASVPKGSFYHYFQSKDAFGEALLHAYFEGYHADIDTLLGQPGRTMAQRLMDYFAGWQDSQSYEACQGKCLAVKLGAEVADLSDAMRSAMRKGTAGTVSRLAAAIASGVAEGSLKVSADPAQSAASLYQLWLGASVMAKVARSPEPFDAAMAATRQLVGLPA